MLSEKFILVLQAILKSNSRGYPDGASRVVSTSPYVPVKLPASSRAFTVTRKHHLAARRFRA
jgi:hypothetical protein